MERITKPVRSISRVSIAVGAIQELNRANMIPSVKTALVLLPSPGPKIASTPRSTLASAFPTVISISTSMCGISRKGRG